MKGEIFWIQDKSNNLLNIKVDSYSTDFYSVEIESGIIDDNMIRLICKKSTDTKFGIDYKYVINLRYDNLKRNYSGSFFNDEEFNKETLGQATCELYKNENNKAIFLYGNWHEDEIEYKWGAKIELP